MLICNVVFTQRGHAYIFIGEIKDKVEGWRNIQEQVHVIKKMFMGWMNLNDPKVMNTHVDDYEYSVEASWQVALATLYKSQPRLKSETSYDMCMHAVSF